MEFKQINDKTWEDKVYTNQIIALFLYAHLEKYGDTVADITKCIDYVMNTNKGGNIIVGIDN